MNPTDDELVAALPADCSPIGMSALAEALGAPFQVVARQAERLARQGRLHIDRPGGGVKGGERKVRRDGDSVESLRRQLGACQAHAATLHTAAVAARDQLEQAIGSVR